MISGAPLERDTIASLQHPLSTQFVPVYKVEFHVKAYLLLPVDGDMSTAPEGHADVFRSRLLTNK